ncbi:MAG: hypothetical protein K8R59_05970 [Thermoanaerobaculales bacterium]|nr:hypothetical protein [Thermoanaerobaculales bacterium]
MRIRTMVVLSVAMIFIGAAGFLDAGTCHHSYFVEGVTPPAIAGINTTETGFVSYFWAWGANVSDQGSGSSGVVDDGGGIAVNPGFLWANVGDCSGEIDGAALLVEAQTTDEGGRFALVASSSAEADIDALQGVGLQSVAEPVPAPVITSMTTGSDAFGNYADVTPSWSTPTTAWAVSDVADVLAGFAAWFVTASAGGPINTGDRSQLTRVEAAAGGSTPYITNDPDTPDGLLPASQESCTIRIRPGEVYFFSLSLIFDGSGASGTDPQADASAVETTYVGASSPGADGASAIFVDGFETGDTSMWSETGS